MTEFEQTVKEAGLAINRARDSARELPNSREKALVLTKLDEAKMWLVEVARPKAEMT